MKHMYHKTLAAIAAVCSVGLAVFAADVLPYSNGRFWQTVFDESAALQWRWDVDAAYAMLSVTNLLAGGAASATQFVREDSALTGSTTMPDPVRCTETGEGLVDVVLVQYDEDDNILREDTARLAFLPTTFTVKPDNSSYRRSDVTRLVSYDSEWKSSSIDAESASLSITTDSGTDATDLSGTAGYFALAPMVGTASLLFDDETTWTSALDKTRGLILIVR